MLFYVESPQQTFISYIIGQLSSKDTVKHVVEFVYCKTYQYLLRIINEYTIYLGVKRLITSQWQTDSHHEPFAL